MLTLGMNRLRQKLVRVVECTNGAVHVCMSISRMEGPRPDRGTLGNGQAVQTRETARSTRGAGINPILKGYPRDTISSPTYCYPVPPISLAKPEILQLPSGYLKYTAGTPTYTPYSYPYSALHRTSQQSFPCTGFFFMFGYNIIGTIQQRYQRKALLLVITYDREKHLSKYSSNF